MHGRIRQSLISEIGCRRLHAIDMRAVTWTYPFYMIYRLQRPLQSLAIICGIGSQALSHLMVPEAFAGAAFHTRYQQVS